MAAAIPERMRALRLRQPGGWDRIFYEETAVPSPAVGDVLVRVHAASFTPTELDWPSSWVDRSGQDRCPAVPGHEVSGVVASVGRGMAVLGVGDVVCGLTDWYRDGTAAEYVAVEARNLVPKPTSLSHEQAAAVPMAGLTAWQALFVHGGLVSGQRVLVHGSGGGVGSLAVQLAKAAGGQVVGTGRGWARDLVLGLGADEFIEIGEPGLQGLQGLQERVAPVDLVLDLVGGELLRSSWSLVRRGGVLVSVVEPPDPEAAARFGVQGRYFIVEPDRAQLGELARRFDAGVLRPVVGRVFKLAEGARAFQAKQGHGLPGKAVWQVVADGGGPALGQASQG